MPRQKKHPRQTADNEVSTNKRQKTSNPSPNVLVLPVPPVPVAPPPLPTSANNEALQAIETSNTETEHSSVHFINPYSTERFVLLEMAMAQYLNAVCDECLDKKKKSTDFPRSLTILLSAFYGNLESQRSFSDGDGVDENPLTLHAPALLLYAVRQEAEQDWIASFNSTLDVMFERHNKCCPEELGVATLVNIYDNLTAIQTNLKKFVLSKKDSPESLKTLSSRLTTLLDNFSSRLSRLQQAPNRLNIATQPRLLPPILPHLHAISSEPTYTTTTASAPITSLSTADILLRLNETPPAYNRSVPQSQFTLSHPPSIYYSAETPAAVLRQLQLYQPTQTYSTPTDTTTAYDSPEYQFPHPYPTS